MYTLSVKVLHLQVIEPPLSQKRLTLTVVHFRSCWLPPFIVETWESGKSQGLGKMREQIERENHGCVGENLTS